MFIKLVLNKGIAKQLFNRVEKELYRYLTPEMQYIINKRGDVIHLNKSVDGYTIGEIAKITGISRDRLQDAKADSI